MVGHEAGDLRPVQRHEEQVAGTVTGVERHRAHRLAGVGQHVHPVRPQRRVR
jgi:hypothetical protein